LARLVLAQLADLADLAVAFGGRAAVAQPGISERLDRLRIVRPQSSYLGVG
jgi:hypothetical protein